MDFVAHGRKPERSQAGFTLSEVVITLAAMGVIVITSVLLSRI